MSLSRRQKCFFKFIQKRSTEYPTASKKRLARIYTETFQKAPIAAFLVLRAINCSREDISLLNLNERARLAGDLVAERIILYRNNKGGTKKLNSLSQDKRRES